MLFQENWSCLLECRDGLPSDLKNHLKRISQLNAESAEQEWMDCLDHIGEYCGYLCNVPEGENCMFPKGRWTFLHHCAFYNAPISVLEEINTRDFYKSFKDSDGKLAEDWVKSNAAPNYKDLFKPKYALSNLNLAKLSKIENRFHEVISSRSKNFNGDEKNNLILPILSVYLEKRAGNSSTTRSGYCAIPGMYGGFKIDFELTEDKSDVNALITDSWCRIVGGSGQQHRCTENKWELVDEGFV